LLPALLLFANAITAPFENMHNKKFIKQAGQVLDETEMIRIAVVGSYGKTSVKNILKTLLSEKYSVVATPESYNTPIGIAKTVFSSEFSGKEMFIAEMGARKAGDIAELCALVKPDYVVFTGVCEQHLQTFGTLENVWQEKSEALRAVGKKAVCAEALKEYVAKDFADNEKIVFADSASITDVMLGATKTTFKVQYKNDTIAVETNILGNSAVENILLATTLASELGLTAEELEKGMQKLQPTPHRLQLLEYEGVYILDDGYNANPRGAKEALGALGRFEGRKCVVTPGIVECGILEESINGALGKELAELAPDKLILVGDTLVGAVKAGYISAGGDAERLTVKDTLAGAQAVLSEWVSAGDAVLFLNDLPDVY
jgi:UDP-N-acetylmuramoyl-tripeptide--D-alanyl-D-alanine ligase